MIFTAALLVLHLIFGAYIAEAQTVEKLKLKRYHKYDYLDVNIDAIGKDCNLRFIYDKEHLHKYKASFDPTQYIYWH